ncbi:glycosyltransferase family 4 protein [Xanthomonas rydalmerensis]|uniref:Glycosyltransferase family 4 protein n=1 Tax=Xanthomonas rydalmerensis TaxID=3046274 RepID=A0ABZ0JPR3_9XANT|nr:glycosyltransferase family 4 protein [Xanthomonas sp. DM-2023]WOS41747.1 glycosyltransferase family 4 protein [Xanthomonas sp. DM-2023]WOS45933.1 glycosyltransferase family 4 protein [Xanthomonas sp. DM-2023]WOS50112.1 glycosyltransferase family 4 protein [Xanthomonas sp. DM-2023]WOS54291.1 glycosyltransferase family 4 protein [Xanthomonas sp. DM-2023]WOS58474.1 glycosyltransferase family 4 protein [Xanthomonas sp. DM-2023]
MHRLTVVQLLPALESGGVERSTLEIAQALVDAGHRAVVVSAGGRLLPALAATGAEHIALDIGRKSLLTLRHVPALRRLFARERADIVHARSRLPAWLGWRALQGMPAAQRPRLVTTVHGLNSPSRYSAVMTRGERVICVSETVRDYVLQHYPQTDPARLRVVPRGIDPAQFPRRPRPDAQAWAASQAPVLAGNGPLLLLPGRGTRLKGHADALRLLASLRGEGSDARLWLPGAREAGREAYIRELEAEAATLGVADAVAFTPPTARIAEAYAASDLVLQLSRKPEAFGRTVVEALAVGRPVLGWAHGGVGELLAQLQPAGAVATFDATALLATARALLAQPPAPPATLPYTLQAMQRSTLAIYDELRP